MLSNAEITESAERLIKYHGATSDGEIVGTAYLAMRAAIRELEAALRLEAVDCHYAASLLRHHLAARLAALLEPRT